MKRPPVPRKGAEWPPRSAPCLVPWAAAAGSSRPPLCLTHPGSERRRRISQRAPGGAVIHTPFICQQAAVSRYHQRQLRQACRGMTPFVKRMPLELKGSAFKTSAEAQRLCSPSWLLPCHHGEAARLTVEGRRLGWHPRGREQQGRHSQLKDAIVTTEASGMIIALCENNSFLLLGVVSECLVTQWRFVHQSPT